MKTYCPQCGSATQYHGRKPNFCQSCGYAFAGASEITEDEQAQVESAPEKLETIPNIAKLDVEITESTQNVFKFGDVIGTMNPDHIGNDGFIPDGKPSPEQQLKDFKREAGTLREKK